jgi:ubiquinone/menaquinone biosynthesis C-methylase UbiE
MKHADSKHWDAHYRKDKSVLTYPDENFVRLVAAFLKEKEPAKMTALDLGCGSGRHVVTLKEMGLGTVLGTDYSMEALINTTKRIPAPFVCAGNTALPFRDATFDLVVSWGSLHYSHKRNLPAMIAEIMRVLKTGGWHIGTLRSSRDTFLKRGRHLKNDVWCTGLEDLEGSVVSFFDEDELQKAFSPYRDFAYGIMERTLPGDMHKLISHWYFRATR